MFDFDLYNTEIVDRLVVHCNFDRLNFVAVIDMEHNNRLIEDQLVDNNQE